MTQPLPEDIQLGDLLVWYVPQVPMKPFERFLPLKGKDPKLALLIAAMLLDTVSEFSAFEFENHVKPDYTDMGGVSRYESDGEGGFDWYDVDEDELEALIA